MTDPFQPIDVEMRRAARERALELLYEAELKGLPVDALLADLAVVPPDLTVELVKGVDAARTAIDEILGQRVAPKWSVGRLAAVDRAVLRLGTYELLHSPQREGAVILNEAVVLARRFGTDDSPRFVNGVLSAVDAEVRPSSARKVTRPALAVDALVIDLDGVIRHWDEAAVTAGDEALGVPPGALADAAFEPGLLERSMRGVITAEEWYAEAGAAVAARHGADADAAAAVMADIGWRIDEGVMELVDEVRRKVPVVLLSNATTRLEADLSKSGILDRFDAVVGSATLGEIKPEEPAYLVAADRAGASVRRCLFVDDREENVAGAIRAGMTGVRFTGVDALAEVLATAGLLGGGDDAGRHEDDGAHRP